ncbi:MAG: aldo/keto reductase [Gemmatimonadota bacterium]
MTAPPLPYIWTAAMTRRNMNRREALRTGFAGATGLAAGLGLITSACGDSDPGGSGEAARQAGGAELQGVAGESPVRKRAIPSSGEEIPVVGIGTARRYDTDSPADKEILREVIRQFPLRGGKVIDTAPSYGFAEEVVGELVNDVGNRDDLFLATKVPLFDRPAGREEGIRMMEESMRILHTDVIDLMQIHNMQGFQELYPVLQEWKEAGRIRYTGMSTSRDPEYPAFLDLMESHDLDLVQVDYSIDNRTAAEEILPLAQAREMGVLVNLPFGRTSVFQKVGDMELPEWTREFDCGSWAQFFLKYILSHPAITCVIPGTATLAYMEDNLGAGRGRLPDADTRVRMEAFFDAL